LTTAFFAHARADQQAAKQLAEFLEFGCDLTCYVDEGLIGDDEDLIARAEDGLSADVLVLLLSPASSPTRWARQRWEEVLVDQARHAHVDVVTVLLRDCFFPPLLRRRNFIEGTANLLTAGRLLKRWFWVREGRPGEQVSRNFSGDLDGLYSVLADQAGTLAVSGNDASRFAREAAQEFAAVFWVPCQGRTLPQAVGELGNQLALTLDGPARENCSRVRGLLAARRCLVVLDAPAPEVSVELTAGGRTSTAITRDAVQILETPHTLPYARSLIAARRYAEAYELLYRLLDAVVEPETCARELTWICEHWDRTAEANVLRFNYGSQGAEQLRLF
jgi:hypothetical protein